MGEKIAKTKKKEGDIDMLARIMKQGFDRMDQGFANVDKRFDKVEGRLDKVEGRLDKVEGRLGKVEGQLDKVEVRLGSLEEDVSYVKKEIVALNLAQDETNRRLSSIERKQAGTLSSLDETVTRSEFKVLANKVAVLEKRR